MAKFYLSHKAVEDLKKIWNCATKPSQKSTPRFIILY